MFTNMYIYRKPHTVAILGVDLFISNEYVKHKDLISVKSGDFVQP